MPKIVDLAAYREHKGLHVANLQPEEHTSRPPTINDAAIWGRDYSTLEGALAGTLIVRAVCDYHLHFNEEWKHYLLCLLERLYALHVGDAAGGLADVVAPLKGYLTEQTNVLTRKEMEIAVLVLDLMERRFLPRQAQTQQEAHP